MLLVECDTATRRSAGVCLWIVGIAALVFVTDGLDAYALDAYDAHRFAVAALYGAAVPIELLVLMIGLFRWFKTDGGWIAWKRGLGVVCVAVAVNFILQLLAFWLGLASIL